MALTSLTSPLMRAILDVIHAHGQTATYDTDWITAQVRANGFGFTASLRSRHSALSIPISRKVPMSSKTSAPINIVFASTSFA